MSIFYQNLPKINLLVENAVNLFEIDTLTCYYRDFSNSLGSIKNIKKFKVTHIRSNVVFYLIEDEEGEYGKYEDRFDLGSLFSRNIEPLYYNNFHHNPMIYDLKFLYNKTEVKNKFNHEKEVNISFMKNDRKNPIFKFTLHCDYEDKTIFHNYLFKIITDMFCERYFKYGVNERFLFSDMKNHILNMILNNDKEVENNEIFTDLMNFNWIKINL